MKQVSGRELCRALQRKGWRLARIKGSHDVIIKQGRVERIVVPVHGNAPLTKGLLIAQMKIAGLRWEEL